MNFKKVERKWQERWMEERIFEAEVDEREKYFCNVPYPYMNGLLHLGRCFTILRVDVMARFKRMQGFNVLFPFAFHCTGTPIVAAAQRIKEGEEIQKRILRDMGIPASEISKFEDPVFWTEYFSREAEIDLKEFGISVDWRRSFITTSLNPYYDKFIRWQFRKLKEKNLVVLGEHPVIWCPKCNSAVGDHARLEGEGETPQEFTLLKFKFEDKFIIAATLRPETVFGQTNLWIDPKVFYVEAKVNEEVWIISEECATKLSNQNKKVEIIRRVKGRELIGKKAEAPMIHRKIPILPSKFCDPSKGTGIVTSVPSDAPDDWIGLYELSRDEEECRRYELNPEDIRAIKPIVIIKSQGWGDFPAAEICEKMGIQSQDEREKLEKAKKEIYRSGFYTGIMKDECVKYAGMKVEDAKDEIKKEMLLKKEADILYEPSGKVVCRCLTPSIVKIVSDQWFIAYGDEDWKKKAHKAVDSMSFYPEVVRKQFHYVVDWLRDWACTREFGLGTRLPWNERWVIESLSDSTIYMAYYTISMYLQNPENKISPEKVKDCLFDFIFLGKDSAKEVSKKTGISQELIGKMRREFNYWYPFDLRNSGKDLVQNHLTFSIFNHLAIFGESFVPKAFSVNGWLLVDMEKMSTSKGTAYPIRYLNEKYGTDLTRITLMYGGEGMDDPNFDTEFIPSIESKLRQFFEFVQNSYGWGREERLLIDEWFESTINRILEEVTESMEQTYFRTAIQKGFFDLQRHLRWYLKRCDVPNRRLISHFIEIQIKLLSPFVPHLAEELWEKIEKNGFISLSSWPEVQSSKIDFKTERAESYLRGVMNDIREIIRVAKLENASKVFIYTAKGWMFQVQETVKKCENLGEAMKIVMKNKNLRERGKEVSNFVKKIFRERLEVSELREEKILQEAKSFLEKELKLSIEINPSYDPQKKAKFAIPGRPAIYIE